MPASASTLHYVKAPYFLTQKLLQSLKDGGSIVNISSGLARFTFAGYSAYGTMKGAVETFTKYLAKELGERQIRVNVVAPGAIETDFGGGVVRDNPELNKMVSSLSEESKWVNAQRLEVAGGIFI
jgi:NAD(P)-dependent dehydrogenase (short-subunit alcohol dehydrogenase family)